MKKNSDVGETAIASVLFQKYSDCDITETGLRLLARRALCRGYPRQMVQHCLEIVIKKTADVIYTTGMMP